MKEISKIVSVVIDTNYEKNLKFVAQLTQAHNSYELKMSEKFYKEYRPKIGLSPLPRLPHWECQLLKLPALLSEMGGIVNGTPFKPHIHTFNGDYFMCCLNDFNDIEDIFSMFKAWCVGTLWSHSEYLCSIFESSDFNYGFEQIYYKYDDNIFGRNEFIKYIKKMNKIEIVSYHLY